ncbi:MAG TPA: glutamate-cysteine ligase family protein [Novosphingobium sp.]|nr:glutamate-cysteine ligase family protein [Novosphingobium sp.]
MGQEIATTGFCEGDFARFSARLGAETALLRDLWAGHGLSRQGPIAGFELEAWLIDRNCFPAPHNQAFLARLADPQVVPELSRFNIELNGDPQPLAGDGLARLEQALGHSWQRCVANAHADVDTAIAIGTLPTLRESDLSLAMMTPSNRYAALNAELARQRGGKPVRIDIASAFAGGEHLVSVHDDVMLEAATTSFQLHLQVPADEIAATLNASLALSAPLLAISANSPFLFGKALWHETRIALFEAAFEQAPINGSLRRVSFGSGWCGTDPTAQFAENHELFPPLLPIVGAEPAQRFGCLRLHNGTIWRWNRLLVGFDDDGQPHLRIEQRVMPAGPSTIDMFANAALYYGAVHMLARRPVKVDHALPFAAARDNFYAAARHGLDAELAWLDGQRLPARKVLASLIALAREGLERLGVDAALVDRYLDLVAGRLHSGRTGAAWQLAHHARHGDLFRLTADYLENQRSGAPVHEWAL